MDNKEEKSDIEENENKIQQRESFGSKAPPKRTMGQIEHSPGHKEVKSIKESESQVQRRHRLVILPPLSKLKIEGSV